MAGQRSMGWSAEGLGRRGAMAVGARGTMLATGTMRQALLFMCPGASLMSKTGRDTAGLGSCFRVP